MSSENDTPRPPPNAITTAIAGDNEEQPPTPTQGINRSWSMGSYPKLSDLMGSWPDFAIFRRFGSLNAQNLLFLQAEITHLENELAEVRAREERNENEKGIIAQRSWYELSQENDDGEPCEQWGIVQDIRQKLKEYSMFIYYLTDQSGLGSSSLHSL